MSALSCTDDVFPDLLCCEDSEILSEDLPECSSDLESPADVEESIARFIENERKYVPGEKTHSHSVDSSARQASVAWILKTNGWPLQLLSVACLSLAAKMEEPLVPSLMDLQIEGSKFLFEARTITRMEFLVLGVLDWKLRSITPFTFLSFFAYKLDSQGTFINFLISMATDIILSNIQESSFLEYWPSCIAAATILHAANTIPNLSCITAGQAESWCEGLHKENIVSCYRLVQEIGIDTRLRKRSKALPQIRVMTRASKVSFGDSESSSSSSSSFKRRRLNNSLWVDDDKETSN